MCASKLYPNVLNFKSEFGVQLERKLWFFIETEFFFFLGFYHLFKVIIWNGDTSKTLDNFPPGIDTGNDELMSKQLNKDISTRIKVHFAQVCKLQFSNNLRTLDWIARYFFFSRNLPSTESWWLGDPNWPAVYHLSSPGLDDILTTILKFSALAPDWLSI